MIFLTFCVNVDIVKLSHANWGLQGNGNEVTPPFDREIRDLFQHISSKVSSILLPLQEGNTESTVSVISYFPRNFTPLVVLKLYCWQLL